MNHPNTIESRVNAEQSFLEDDLLLEDKIDLRRYYRAVLKRWWLVLLITLGISVPWALYLKSQPPVYEAEVLIRFSDGGDDADVQRRRTELRSRSFAETVVAQLGLCMTFELDKANWINRNQVFRAFSTSHDPVPGHYLLKLTESGQYELYLQVGEDDPSWRLIKQGFISEAAANPVAINGVTFQLTENRLQLPAEIPFEIKAFRHAVKSFQNRINVNTDRSGTLMSVKLTDNDPHLVAEMTNRLAEIFLQHTTRLKNEGITSRRQILENQLKIASQELEEADRKLKEFKERYSTYLNPNAQSQTNDLAAVQNQEQRVREILQTLQGLLAKREEAVAADGADSQRDKSSVRFIMLQIVGLSIFDSDPNMLILRQQLKDFETQWNNVVSIYSAENPKAKEALREILLLHDQVEAEAQRKLQELRAELNALIQQRVALERKLRQLPEQERVLSELERTHKVLERKYTDLLARYQQAKIDEQVQSKDAEILDPAVVPELPTNRDKKKNAAFGGLLGLILGLGVVIGIEFFDKSIKTVDDAKRALRLNVLGTIPQIDFSDVYDFQDSEKIKQIDQQLVTHDYSPTPVGEAYRSLRTNLLFSEKSGKLQSLVITSTEPGDGKSFTAANLAITLAQLKSNTLLVDSDLRRGVLHNTFGVRKEPGFSNYLTSALPLASILRETHIPNLTLISCGSLIPNPSELLGSHQMRRFLDEIRRRFELILFDTPPLNAATDAVVLGTQVDGVVLVIRAGRTDRDVARQKLELFSQVPARILGVVLNGTTADMAHPGYSYYHY